MEKQNLFGINVSKRMFIVIIIGLFIVNCRGCEYCGCYGYPNCDCYCPPWMFTGDDHIILDQARGQVSVSSSAAASVKYNKGAPQAYISSLSSAKADPKVPVNIVGNGTSGATISQGGTPPPPHGPTPPHPVTTQVPVATKTAPIAKHTWGYKDTETAYGPANWGALAPQCNGNHQSPIDIVSAHAMQKPIASDFKLVLTHDDPAVKASMIVKGKFINNGKALGYNVAHTETPVKLTGAVFKNEMFTLRQFHFHFGCEGEMGSEHSLDGQRFPGELHFIFTNDKYPSPKVAMQQADGLAALAFFIQYDPAAKNPAFARINENLKNLRMPHGSMQFPDGLSLTNLVPALKEGLGNLRRFAYKGSLPTPPCFETVTWVVFRRAINMNPATLESMRNMLQGENDRMCNNFRPAQPINDRRIFAFVPGPPVPTTAAPSGGQVLPTLPTPAAAVPEELARAIPGRIPIAKLIGNQAKTVDDKVLAADTRHDMQNGQNNDMVKSQAASGTNTIDNKNTATVQELTSNSPVNPAFTKNSDSKESKLIPEGNAKQELSKDVEKTPSFAGKPGTLASNGQLNKIQNAKPSVAPGMRRQNLKF